MARVTRTEKSRKDHVCAQGGHVIPAGSPYLSASPGFRRRRPITKCVDHPFRPSELTTSLASGPLAAQEAFEDTIAAIDREGDDALDELEAAHQELLSEVESYRDERQAALDAWENGNSQLQELVDTADEACSEVEGFQVDVMTRDDFDTAEEYAEHVEAQFDEAESMASGLEF